MFNHEDYQRAHAAKKLEIKDQEERYADPEAGVSPQPAAWRETVDRRYAAFIALNASDRIRRGTDLLKALEEMPWTSDVEKATMGVGQEIVQACSSLHFSSAILTGMAKVADPVGAEATMRLYAEAAKPFSASGNMQTVEAGGSVPSQVSNDPLQYLVVLMDGPDNARQVMVDQEGYVLKDGERTGERVDISQIYPLHGKREGDSASPVDDRVPLHVDGQTGDWTDRET